nr:MAG TPA: hypothetical protein [Caudoviricetes sp.]DAM28332.1 MAG TPA: hypothetical protein [Caudoviricetes sp.]
MKKRSSTLKFMCRLYVTVAEVEDAGMVYEEGVY